MSIAPLGYRFPHDDPSSVDLSQSRLESAGFETHAMGIWTSEPVFAVTLARSVVSFWYWTVSFAAFVGTSSRRVTKTARKSAPLSELAVLSRVYVFLAEWFVVSNGSVSARALTSVHELPPFVDICHFADGYPTSATSDPTPNVALNGAGAGALTVRSTG